MNITKKTAFGITGAAAAALIVAGAAVPAMASEGDSTSITKSYAKTSSQAFHYTNESPIVVAPDVDLLGGGIANGDNGNGNVVGSGNDTLSGNEVTAPLLSGNDTAVGNGNSADVSDVSDISSDVSDLVDNGTDASLNDLVDLDEVTSDVSGWVNLDHLFED